MPDYLAEIRRIEATLAALHRQTLEAHAKKVMAPGAYRRMMQDLDA